MLSDIRSINRLIEFAFPQWSKCQQDILLFDECFAAQEIAFMLAANGMDAMELSYLNVTR
jgi:hypothetical protein